MDNSTFSYTYSAPLNQEVQAIRQKYMPKVESKLDELKRLDHDVQCSGMIESLSVGITGCLVFGLGMCLAMKVVGSSMLLGVIISMIGILIMIPAYPIYRTVSSKVKGRLVPRILQLADELDRDQKRN